MTRKDIVIAGAGIAGLWQAYVLAKAGHRVRVFDLAAEPFAESASRYAGAMLAPECEAEAAPPIVRDLGRQSLALWRAAFDGVVQNGTLVVASVRDRSDLTRYQRVTENHQLLHATRLAEIEPDLATRFDAALYFPSEAHMDAMQAMRTLLAGARSHGAEFQFGQAAPQDPDAFSIDCRGMAARRDIADLRAVRGERLVVSARDVRLARPVRLLHPRQPIYVVPQGDGRFVIGATVIEREDDGPVTVRSALELLGSAFALDPGFGEAAILDVGAGLRPAYADNVPRIRVAADRKTLRVNGMYRHGFLLAPVMAEAVAAYLDAAAPHPLISVEG